MYRLLLTLAVLSIVFPSATHVSAQEVVCLHRTLPFNVEDANGIQIHGLKPADFQAKSRSGLVKILSILPDERPHRIVMLLDASASMAPKWKRALVTASALAEAKLPNTELALLIFGDKTYEQISFSEGQRAVAERLRQLCANTKDLGNLLHGKTALYDSLVAGLQLLGTSTSADILYLVSDGADTASHAKFDQVAHRLTSSEARLFVSLVLDANWGISATSDSLGAHRTPNPEEIDGPRDLEALVRKTGGETIVPFNSRPHFRPEKMEQIKAALDDFHQSMIRSYLLEVDLPGLPDKKGTWELKPSNENKERWKNVRVTYPEELEPCAP